MDRSLLRGVNGNYILKIKFLPKDDKLRALKKLLDEGVLSEEEFTIDKNGILNQL